MIDHVWEPKGLVRCFHGVVSLKQVARSDEEVQSSPVFDDLRYLIDDFLDCVNVVDIDPATIHELAAIAAVAVRRPGQFRHAVVSRLREVEDLAKSFADSGFATYLVRHFEQLDDARRWVMA